MCADKPCLLIGLLVLYACLCWSQEIQTASWFDSVGLLAAFFSTVSTEGGFVAVLLLWLVIAAIADAIVDVEAEVRQQERFRLKQ